MIITDGRKKTFYSFLFSLLQKKNEEIDVEVKLSKSKAKLENVIEMNIKK